MFHLPVLLMNETQLRQVIQITAATDQQGDRKKNQKQPQDRMKILAGYFYKFFQFQLHRWNISERIRRQGTKIASAK